MDNETKFKVIKSLVGKPDPVIIEVGARYGEDTKRFLQTFPMARMFCFEPDPRNYKILSEQRFGGDVLIYVCALSNVDTLATLYQGYSSEVTEHTLDKYSWIGRERYINEQLNASGASSLKPGHKYVTNTSTIEVNVKRFDTWHKEVNPGEIDFMWIDVQGAERDVIEGLGDTTKQIRFIWTEYGETDYQGAMTRQQTINLLESKGFRLLTEYSSIGEKGDLVFVRIK